MRVGDGMMNEVKGRLGDWVRNEMRVCDGMRDKVWVGDVSWWFPVSPRRHNYILVPSLPGGGSSSLMPPRPPPSRCQLGGRGRSHAFPYALPPPAATPTYPVTPTPTPYLAYFTCDALPITCGLVLISTN